MWRKKRLAFFGGNKLSALFAYLAVESKTMHSREKLVELLWPGMSINTGRANLRHTVFQLRNSLIDQTGLNHFLQSTRDSLGLSPSAPFRIDASELNANSVSCHQPLQESCSACRDQMARMVQLYRGEFMSGFSLPNCQEFENWMNIKRESYHRSTLSLLERLSNYHSRSKNYHDAIQFTLRQIELEPWNESGYAKAIRLYALDGQSAAALSMYETCVQVLRQEMNAPPSKETSNLAASIRDGSFQADARIIAPGRITGEVNGALPVARTSQPQHPERRQVTVLYCEFNTLTSEHPDDINLAVKRIGPHLSKAMTLAEAAGAYVTCSGAGGFFAYFGYPHPCEDAAPLAVRTGLSMVNYNIPEVDCHVGIHAGWIVTGKTPAAVPDIAGYTSRVAMQLGIFYGEPGKVILSEDVRRLVRAHFRFRTRGKRQVSNQAGRVEVYAVSKKNEIRHRLPALNSVTPFVGRDAEIFLLTKLWREVKAGARHMVLLQGEAGIGKTRLAREFVTRQKITQRSVLYLQGAPEFQKSPFRPFITLLEDLCGFTSYDMPEIKLEKWNKFHQSLSPAIPPDSASTLAKLLVMDFCENPHDRSFPTFESHVSNAILHLFHSLIDSSDPCLLIIDNLQWIDASSKNTLIRHMGSSDLQGSKRILIVLAHRGHLDWPILGDNPTILTLPPLTGEEASVLLTSLDPQMGSDMMQSTISRSDGIPLFAEELLHAARTSSELPIPSTLHDLLATRLNSAGDAKQIAQLASVIGQEFGLDELRQLSPVSLTEVMKSVEKLQQSGLIQETIPKRYRFRRKLIQEAAYLSLLLSARKEIRKSP